MIKFKNVKYKNFLSTGNVFTEIDLCKNPTTLITGHNGAGKSTFLDAITFALFGKPFRNINKPTLVNAINEKECVVEIQFDVGSKKFKIIRGIKPTIFEIWCNSKLINQDAKAKDYQEHLESSILKMNYKSFTQIVILGSTNFTPFMQLNAADRRAVIEDLLDIQIFSSMNSIVKDNLTILKDETSTIRIQIDATRGKIELHKKHLDELKSNTRELIDQKRNEIISNTALVESLIVELTKVNNTIDTLTKSIIDVTTVTKKLNKMTTLGAKIENNMDKVTKDLEFYQTSNTCPTCDQSINNKEEKVHSCTIKIEEMKSGLEKLKFESDSVSDRLDSIKNTQDKIIELQKSAVDTSAKLRHVKGYIAGLEAEIVGLEKKPTMSLAFKAQSKELLDSLQELINRRNLIANETQNFDIVAQMLKDGGIKAKIIKQYIPIINKTVNKYLNAMDFFVNFTLDEEFKESIKSRHRDNFSYENFSEGEKARLNLAILFTWRTIANLKNTVSTNLLILDEVFDGSLDVTGTEQLLEILSSVKHDTNIFIITHKTDQMLDKFNNVIRFEKEKNFSTIKNENRS